MGKLSVIGIGPGNRDNLTFGADKALRNAEVIVGYTLYINLIRDSYPGKEFISTPMTKEAERCRTALDLASRGKNTALVCSGDSGIYGMAGLVYELRGPSDEPEIEVIPGITSASGGSALLGAPLTHDFAVISLSDRLTDWNKIVCRLESAAKADFCIVLYNPASKGRPDHLKKACDILLSVLPEDLPCGAAHAIGREGESFQVLTLRELRDYPADMFCTIFIGNSSTHVIEGKLVTPRGYHL
ncbi:MAG: precorrin-3B C(17)-methyltransferase [Anaerolineaceae bacterium]|nr:precorrin-3B C(17)-methyltransferase [Anaerolineaceae bacterium]